MPVIRIVCPSCGRIMIQEIVDEDAPPASISCDCGCKIAVAFDQDEGPHQSYPELDDDGEVVEDENY